MSSRLPSVAAQQVAPQTRRPQVVRSARRSKHALELHGLSEMLGQGQYETAIIRLQLLFDQHREDVQTAELLASAYILAHKPDRALKLVRGVVGAHPEDLSLNRVLYRAATAAGDQSATEHALLRIAKFDEADGKSLEQLADLQRRSGRLQAAIPHYRAALERDGSLLGAYQNLSGCLIETGKPAEAVAVTERALKRFNRLPELYYNLGLGLEKCGRLEDAANAYSQAIDRNPRYVKALSNLGNALQRLGRLDEAEARLRTALDVEPRLWPAHANLGNVLKAQGLLEQSRASYRRAAQLQPDAPLHWSNLIALLPYLPDYSATEQSRIMERFNASVCRANAQPSESARKPRPRRRRIRIGYVSADFHKHVCMYFVEPVLERHDRNQFRVFCYDNTEASDSVSARLRRLDCTWRKITRSSDAEVAAMIEADRIDILVDLMGHTVGHRLGIFALRPAPVQMTWQGFVGSTGLTAMDYWITDQHIMRRDVREAHTEAFAPLPNGERCFRPEPDAPPVHSPPFARNGAITFGNFSAVNKLNGSVLDLWSLLLDRMPKSKLILVSVPEGKATVRIQQHFAARGIAPERIQIISRVPHTEFLQLHGEVDVMLDTFPFNGCTTTMYSLWMGVPVLTMEGERYSARVGESIMRTVGLEALIARSPADYLEKAQQLARDTPWLAKLRSSLRSRMQSSPLMDEVGFTRNLEELYRSRVAPIGLMQKA